MLSLLVGLAISKSTGYQAPSDSSKTAFDITVDGSSVTNGEGFYVAFREIDENNEPGAYQYIKWNTNRALEVADKYKVSVKQEDDKEGSKRIYFSVQNLQLGKPLKFNLGVFADAYFETGRYGGDTASVSSNKNGAAILVSGSSKYAMFIVKGTKYPDVDTIYIGDFADSAKKSPDVYPYWTNEIPKSGSKGDSVLAFSWQNRIVPAGSSADYGFIAVPYFKYTMQPVIRDITEQKDEITGTATLKFQVIDYDSQDVTLTLTVDGKTETKKYSSTGPKEPLNKTFSKDVTIEKGQEVKYTAYLTYGNGLKTESIEDTLRAVGARKPTFTLEEDLLQPDYNPGDVITFGGTVDDEELVYFKYQINNGVEETMSNPLDTSGPGEKTFHFQINIPTYVTLNQTHELKFWFEDQYGHKSGVKTHSFKYIMPDRPYISSAFLSDERLIYNETYEIVVYGDATDPDNGQVISVLAHTETDDYKNMTTFISSDKIETFAFFYTIKANQFKPGRHTITLRLQDETGKQSKNETVLSFLIWDPDQPLPPSEIGRIIDVSSETLREYYSDSLFNLRYVSTDSIQHNMSFNNEGFYAAFRVYSHAGFGGTPYKTHIMKFSRYFNKFDYDNFTVTFEMRTEESTGYLKPTFIVKNNNFFPRKFELGVFVDSDFSGDDNSALRLTPDRTIVVTNDQKKIHYSIITRNILDSPSVSRVFLKGVPRSGNKQIPFDQMPFFNKTDNNELSGVNAMYGFSWTKTVDPDTEIPFAVAFAAHDKVKQRPRVTDDTKITESLNIGGELTLAFTIKDADQSEKIRINLTTSLPGLKEKSYDYTNTGSYTITEKVKITKSFFWYRCIAEDIEEGAKLYSNEIFNYLFVNNAPRIYIDRIKSRYHNKEPITLTGSFTDDGAVTIKYQFVNYETRSKTLVAGKIEEHQSQRFSLNITIPPEVYPKDDEWKIVVFSVDDFGIKSNEVSYTFYLNEYNPPKLFDAGVNKKAATIGEQLVGFAIVQDQENDNLDIFVKIDKDSSYPAKYVRRIFNREKTGQRLPIGFFWTVPADVKPGAHDLVFIVRDSESLESQEITKRIYIQENI